jgi:thiol-disulfide isomerase/thioredoxin
MLPREVLSQKFAAGLPYELYVLTGKPEQQAAWKKIYDQAHLSEAQRGLVRSFSREMNVLVISGTWCGDCVQQCPLLEHIAAANPAQIRLRFLDRDEHKDLSAQLPINGGVRVPVALFLAEDFEFVSLLGDRTLARYRAIAARQLGPSCPLPGAPVSNDELAATLQDWLNEFERVQLLLRLSARLRQKHGD